MFATDEILGDMSMWVFECKTNEDVELDLYELGGLTQLGLCVMFNAAYSGLLILNAL